MTGTVSAQNVSHLSMRPLQCQACRRRVSGPSCRHGSSAELEEFMADPGSTGTRSSIQSVSCRTKQCQLPCYHTSAMTHSTQAVTLLSYLCDDAQHAGSVMDLAQLETCTSPTYVLVGVTQLHVSHTATAPRVPSRGSLRLEAAFRFTKLDLATLSF